jgi:menaquinone-specific isochorismate synthase
VTLVSVASATTLRAELHERAKEAVERATRLERPVLASAAVELEAEELDVAACVFGNRSAAENYFVWEQPERDRFALGCLGSAWTIEGIAGEDRFATAAVRCAEALHEAVLAPAPARVPGAGPVWTAGFAFSPEGGRTPEWRSLPPGVLILPAVSLARLGSSVFATLNVSCRPTDEPGELVAAAGARLESLREAPIPLHDPDPFEGFDIASVLPPEHYEEAVLEARRRIRAGELEKVVLAREVKVEASAPFQPAAVFDALRTAFPGCFCFCVGTADVAFIGASPELLVRREGATVSTVALAGSTRRSADPAVDDHLGQRLLQSDKDREEHAIVARRIERMLEPLSVWVASAEEPSLVKVENIQHLATPIRAQLAEPRSAVEIAGVLHPTPAVGGEPSSKACELIEELEELDRGWYAAPVGWVDAADDGEFCVAIRCALLEGRTAHCYAGNGVVASSDPEAELAETEVKLQALLAVLTGG